MEVDPSAPGRNQGPIVRPDVLLDRDRRIEQPGATDARGPDALEAPGRLDVFPGPVQGLPAHAGQLARGLQRF